MRYALLHWRFFERFVTETTHWLAPDNFQEDPEPVVARRTSPTNIGLQLLSNLAAYDFGYVSIADDPWRGILYLVMPIMTLFLHEIGVLMRMARASTLEVLRLDYITHARAKGL